MTPYVVDSSLALPAGDGRLQMLAILHHHVSPHPLHIGGSAVILADASSAIEDCPAP
jgi:hypothetical protein